jgi:hypothetical protein
MDVNSLLPSRIHPFAVSFHIVFPSFNIFARSNLISGLALSGLAHIQPQMITEGLPRSRERDLLASRSQGRVT